MTWTWKDTWMGFLLVGVIAVAALLGTAILADHKPQLYYPVSGISSSCVSMSSNWETDITVYCSDDKEKVLDFVNRSNAALKAAR